MQSVPGTINITGWDGSGSGETCSYKISINGEPFMPSDLGSSIVSSNLDEIDINKCHNYLQYVLRTRGLDRMSEAVGRRILWYNITDYLRVPNALQLPGITDATFTLQFVDASSVAGKPIPMKCPIRCFDSDSNGHGVHCNPPQTKQTKVTEFLLCCGTTCFPDLI